ncbi:MAG: HD-GYP domain-containing protein [Clostridiales bacterium]|nr:HD-GYP domain-containing protein [Candidatus Crickella merdequi]
MEFNQLCFFISQLVFIPAYLMTTKRLFRPELRTAGFVSFFLISPFCVYFYSILFYGILSVFIPSNEIFEDITAYADIFALFVSFAFAWIYSRTARCSNTKVPFFVYISFYMIGMVFSLVYNGTVAPIILSIIIPIITSLLTFKYITIPLDGISNSFEQFHSSMLLMPVIAEIMLVFRFVINIASMQNEALLKYDNALLIYCTLFGYIVLIFLFISTGMITKDIMQISQITEDKNHINQFSIDMLEALTGTIDAKDKYTNGHSHRVSEYSVMLAKRMDVSKDIQENIERVALLHDIGKIAIPDAIISKPGRLTDEEYDIIKSHTTSGSDILSGIREMPDLYIGALYHHERWDGNGYPNGVAGEDIPMIARIISVADAYDAMTSHRSYRTALSREQVRQEIKNGIGTQFYPAAAKAMLELIDEDTDYMLRPHEII